MNVTVLRRVAKLYTAAVVYLVPSVTLSLAPATLHALQINTAAPANAPQRKDSTPVLPPPADTAMQQERWFPSPTPTRLLFGPTGRVLPKGKSYIADHWVFLVSGGYGVTDRITIGGGMSLLPTDNFLTENVYFVTPKVAVLKGERVNASVGAFIGTFPFANDDKFNTFGIAYGAASWGTPDASFTAGAGYGFVNGDIANKPALMLGTELRFARRASFVSENYILPEVGGAVLSYGVRLMGESLSVDLAFVNLTSNGKIPGVPFIGFAFQF